jgi:hypothetical protein
MIEEAFAAFVDSRLDKKLAPYRDAIQKLKSRNIMLTQAINGNKAQISKLEKLCEEYANEIKMLSNRIEKFEKAAQAAESIATNVVLSKFNAWAANPAMRLPSDFIYLSGDFKMFAKQQLIQTPEESKWISNREGAKKYLLPNPCFFNQMTNISELYEMDQTMLKEKGKNKIKIVVPCEISSSGFVEFPGKLQILP